MKDIRNLKNKSIIDAHPRKTINAVKKHYIKQFGEKYAPVINERLDNTTIIVAPQIGEISKNEYVQATSGRKAQFLADFYNDFLELTGLEHSIGLQRVVKHVLTSRTNISLFYKAITDYSENKAMLEGHPLTRYFKPYVQKDATKPFTKRSVNKLLGIYEVLMELWPNFYADQEDLVDALDKAEAEHYKNQLKNVNRDIIITDELNLSKEEDFALEIIKAAGLTAGPILYEDLYFVLEQLGKNPKDILNPKHVPLVDAQYFVRMFTRLAPGFAKDEELKVESSRYTIGHVANRPELKTLFSNENRTLYEYLQYENFCDKVYADGAFIDAALEVERAFIKNKAETSIYPYLMGLWDFMHSPGSTGAYVITYPTKNGVKALAVFHEVTSTPKEHMIHESGHAISIVVVGKPRTSKKVVTYTDENGKKCKETIEYVTYKIKLGALVEDITYVKSDDITFNPETFAYVYMYQKLAERFGPVKDENQERETPNKKTSAFPNSLHDRMLFMEIINQYFTLEGLDAKNRELNKVYGTNSYNPGCLYEEMFPYMKPWLDANRDKVLECWMSKDPLAFEKAFGEIDILIMVEAINSYFINSGAKMADGKDEDIIIRGFSSTVPHKNMETINKLAQRANPLFLPISAHFIKPKAAVEGLPAGYDIEEQKRILKEYLGKYSLLKPSGLDKISLDKIFYPVPKMER